VLSPELLAGYLDGELPDEERAHVERHLADCHECRAELADIRRLQSRRRRQRMLLLIPAAAAAALLVTIALPRQPRTPSAVRAGAPVEAPLAIVSPAADAEIQSRQIRFMWESAGTDASYTFTLQKADGSVVWTSSTTDTFIVLPDSIVLAARQKWFWSVDALLPDGRLRATNATMFRTPP
jgi:hypothetical protein